jgi:hypothetical protein
MQLPTFWQKRKAPMPIMGAIRFGRLSVKLRRSFLSLKETIQPLLARNVQKKILTT